MSMGINLQLRQSQALVMTPQLQQAIKLLQMSNLDLAEFVAQEIEQNPFLEVAPATPEERRGASERQEPETARDTGTDVSGELSTDNLNRASETFDTGLENIYADQSRAERLAEADAAANAVLPGESNSWSDVGSGGGASFDDPEFSLEGTLVADKTLREHLLDQLGISSAAATVRPVAALLIEQIDESGYLHLDTDEFALRIGADQADVEKAIALIQGFDPVGVGARDLAECLTLQLRDRNRFDPAIGSLIANLDLLAAGKLPKLVKICGVSSDELREMIDEVRALDPKPGARFEREIAQTLIPDAFVRKNSFGSWSVELNSETLPRVLVNTRYATQVAKGGGDVKDYLTDRLQTANWLAKSLDQRARTILKVASEIVRQQDSFLEYGVSELRPLNLKTVAEAIGMHESTVSRVTSNKYLSTARGVFELKFFFSAAIASTEGGEAYSAESVRHRIKQMIDSEPADAILSDEQIVKNLRTAGIDVARRTVAKYREAMNIASSIQRRRQKAQALR